MHCEMTPQNQGLRLDCLLKHFHERAVRIKLRQLIGQLSRLKTHISILFLTLILLTSTLASDLILEYNTLT